MAESVEIRLEGDPGSALRAIEEVKVALATLTDKTVRVRVEQEKAASSAERMARSEQTLARAETTREQGRANTARSRIASIREEERAFKDLDRTMTNFERRRRGGGGGGGGLFGSNQRVIRNLSGIDTGGAGLRLRTVGIAGGIAGVTGLIKPLTDVLGLVGALPATFGAAGIAMASFKAIGASAMEKAVKDQQTATDKFKAGTITAKAYSNAMKNALIGLSAEQRKALPFFQQWNDVVQSTSEKIRQKMLPALNDLAKGVKANKASIVAAFGGGAGIIGTGLTQLGGFLASNAGQRGIHNLGASSRDMLGGLTSGGVALFRSLLSIVTAARPLVRALSNDFTRLTAQFAAWSGSFRGQQALTKWFSDSEVAAKKFIAVLFNLGKGIQNIGGGIGTGFLDWLVKVTAQFEKWTENKANVDRLAASMKRIADTLMVVASAVARVAPMFASMADSLTKTFGPNTMGYLLLGRVAFKGLSGLAKGAGGLLGTLGKLTGKGAAAEAGAEGAAAGAGGGVLASLGLSAGMVAASAAALTLLAAPIVYVLLKTKDVAQEWRNVENAVRRAGAAAQAVGAATAAQQSRVAQLAALRGSRPGAELALFDAKAQLAADKKALPGMKGQAAARQKIIIDVDAQAVKNAQADFDKLNQSIKDTRRAIKLHANDAKDAGRVAQTAANDELKALETNTDALAKQNAAHHRTAAGLANSAHEAENFAAKMQATARQIGNTNPVAARFATTAANLATKIKSIPTTKQVNVAIIGATTAEDTLREIHRLAQSETKHVTTVTDRQNAGHYSGGKITTPTAIVGEQAPIHPEYVIATNPQYRDKNKGLVSQAAAALGGQVRFFATGGQIGPTPPGIAGAMALANQTAGANTSKAGTAMANEYAGIPAHIKALKAEIVRLHTALSKGAKFIAHEHDLALHYQDQARHQPDHKKKLALQDKARNITQRVIPKKKRAMHGWQTRVKNRTKDVEKLTEKLADLVPGEQAFQDAIAAIEGQMAAASFLGRPKDADDLKAREITDYKARIGYLIAFTGAKSTIRNRPLFNAASAALGGDKNALDALLGDSAGTSAGGAGSADSAQKDQALAMLEELTNLAKQGQLSNLIGNEELATAMKYISTTVGSFAKGSPFVPKTGMAMVHQGEAIVPAWANPNRPSGGGGTMTGVITLEGSDELTRAIANAVGPHVNVQMGSDLRRMIRQGVR